MRTCIIFLAWDAIWPLTKLGDSRRTHSEVRPELTMSFENHEPDERVFKTHWNTFVKRLLTLVFSVCLLAAAKEPSMDFSYAGYGGGGVAEPTVATVVSVRPSGGDDTGLLQGAIDHVSALALTKNGFRGAVLLMPGRYRVAATAGNPGERGCVCAGAATPPSWRRARDAAL